MYSTCSPLYLRTGDDGRDRGGDEVADHRGGLGDSKVFSIKIFTYEGTLVSCNLLPYFRTEVQYA